MRRFTLFSLALIGGLLMLGTASAAVPEGADEITSLVTIKPPSARIVGDPTIHSQLRLTNRSKLTIQGPLGVVVHIVKPEGATLVQGTGSLADGDAYVQLLGAEEQLQPAASSPFFTLLFDNPQGKRLKYRLTAYGVLPGAAEPQLAGRANVTGMVKFSLPRPRFSAKTQTYRTQLRLTNVSASSIDAPLTVALPTLLPEGVTLVGGDGELTDGTPLIHLALPNDSLAAGKKSPPLPLEFTAPARTRIQVVPAVYGKLAPISGSDPLFSASNAWNQRVDSAPLHAQSAAMLAQLKAAGGWGAGDTMRIDFSINVLEASAATPFRQFTPNGNFWSPDCDEVAFPAPEGGAVEGEDGYACTQGGDCHLLVVDRSGAKLYEMYSASISGGKFSGGCAVVWDLSRSYPAELRGDQCTSSDAAGLPIAPLLFSADEIAAGSIDHAIRFILPNNRMRAKAYVRPATHAGAPSSTNPLAIPYGSRLRLRADYPLETLPSDAARVIARAMQRYGMILADGGNIALTARNDRFTEHSWAEVGIEDSYPVANLKVEDFEVVDTGPIIDLTYDCVRNGY